MIKTAQEEVAEIIARYRDIDNSCRRQFSYCGEAAIPTIRKLRYFDAQVALAYIPENIKQLAYEKEVRYRKWRQSDLHPERTEFMEAFEYEQNKPVCIASLLKGILPRSLYEEIILVQNEFVRNQYIVRRNKWISFEGYERVSEDAANALRTDAVPWSDVKLLPQGMGIEPPNGYERSPIDSYYAADVFASGRRNHRKFHACHGLNGGCICFHCKNDRPECCTKHCSNGDVWYAEAKACRDCSCPDFVPEEPNKMEYGFRIYSVCCGHPRIAKAHDNRVELRVESWDVYRKVVSYGFWDDAKWESVLGRKPVKSKLIDLNLVYEYFNSHPFEFTDKWKRELKYGGRPMGIVCERNPASPLRQNMVHKGDVCNSYPWKDDAYELQGWLETDPDTKELRFWFVLYEEGTYTHAADEEIKKLNVVW